MKTLLTPHGIMRKIEDGEMLETYEGKPLNRIFVTGWTEKCGLIFATLFNGYKVALAPSYKLLPKTRQ